MGVADVQYLHYSWCVIVHFTDVVFSLMTLVQTEKYQALLKAGISYIPALINRMRSSPGGMICSIG